MTTASETNKTALVTGANSGIGLETARGLAKAGMEVVMVCRSRKRGEIAREEIKQSTGQDRLTLLIADLSSMTSIRILAKTVHEQFSKLEILINNAAVICPKPELTKDRFERQFAVNHLAPFLLTHLLLDLLKQSGAGRIINVSSQMHQRTKFDFNNLQGERDYHPRRVYAQTKLANVLFTMELSRRLKGTGITANSLHPGTVSTGLFGTFLGLPRWLKFLWGWFGVSPEKGAKTSLYLATSPQVAGISGRYFKNSRPYPVNPIANDENIAKRLWDLSADLTGVPASQAF